MELNYLLITFKFYSQIRYIGDAKVRVSLARPRTRGAVRRGNFDPNMYDDE